MSTTTWTAATLLTLPVTDVDGRHLGWVRDVRLDHRDEAWTVRGLVVGRRLLSERLGYASGTIAGPALLTAWLRRRQAHLRWVPWDDVAGMDASGVRLGVAAGDLAPVPEVQP